TPSASTTRRRLSVRRAFPRAADGGPQCIIDHMRLKTNGLWFITLLAGLTVGLSAQSGPPVRSTQQSTQPGKPTFSLQIDLVTTDVIARDNAGNFTPTLTKDDFEIYEDGVKQDIVSMTLSHGGRVT